MVSASIDPQDESGGFSLDVGPHSVKSVQLKDQFTAGDDYAPKVRKQYTITKQRERWTEDEHKKFLEALKLYGRAWRHIEEHVGTKTAVQIRSHAQKYFSKVVRESSSSAANSVKPIEIPPPRPKRKPMHPYPRKVVSPLKTGTHFPEQQTRSMSPNLSVSEQDNQSPVTVLAAIGSDSMSSPSVTPSPVSSTDGVKPSVFLPSEPNPSPDINGSSSPDHENTSKALDEQVPMKLELFPQDNDFQKEGSAEESSTQILKLFGTTVLITDSHQPSSPNMGMCKSLPLDTSDGAPAQTLQWNIMPMPWWSLYGGVSGPFLQLHNPIPVKTHPSSDDKELQKEGSWTGSDTGSVNAGDRSWDIEPQSHQIFLDNEENDRQRSNPSKCIKGFVPYKRCLAERNNTHSSTMSGEEREEQRIRLCL